jgi:alpha/beta superfamily hydrolase
MSEDPGAGGSTKERSKGTMSTSETGGKEAKVVFVGDASLEGMLGWPGGTGTAASPDVEESAGTDVRGGVVVAHPYPPHGANMDLPVVFRIAKSCRQRGFATLRFNFRSVGGSQGTFSGTEEDRDVTAAVSFLEKKLATVGDRYPVGLAGYSFGSIMAARAAAELPVVRALALVGFGVGWEGLPPDTLERLERYDGPLLAVCAENDDYGSPKDLCEALTGLGLDHTMEVIHGADHFLGGRDREVGQKVAEFFSTVLGGEQSGRREQSRPE